MNDSMLADVLVLLAATLLVVASLRRLRLPPVLGFLVVGALLGPHALGWVEETQTTTTLAEFGVVFLLFTLGLEFSLPRLIAMRNEVFALGSAQVGFTALAFGGIAWWLGSPPEVAVVLGGAVAMSSTAIVVQQLSEQGELNRTHGRLSFGILLFQDLAIMPALVLLPLIGAAAPIDPDWRSIGVPLVAIAAIVGAGRYLLRPLLRVVAATRAQEAFTAATLLVVVATALLFDSVGLSMALGAFIAGVLLADSEYRHELEANIEPFKGLLLGLFFIAVGMSANLGVVADAPLAILGLTLGYLALKAIAIFVAARIARLTNAGRPPVWSCSVRMSGVFGQKFGPKKSDTGGRVSSRR